MLRQSAKEFAQMAYEGEDITRKLIDTEVITLYNLEIYFSVMHGSDNMKEACILTSKMYDISPDEVNAIMNGIATAKQSALWG